MVCAGRSEGGGQQGRVGAGRCLSCALVGTWRENLQLPSSPSLSCILHIWGCSSKSALSKDTANPKLRTWQRIRVQLPTPSGLVSAICQLPHLPTLSLSPSLLPPVHISHALQVKPVLRTMHTLSHSTNPSGLPLPEAWNLEKAHCWESSRGWALFGCAAGRLAAVLETVGSPDLGT